MEFKGDGGCLLGILLNFLIVFLSLCFVVNKIVKVMFGEGGVFNLNYEVVDVKVVNWLV